MMCASHRESRFNICSTLRHHVASLLLRKAVAYVVKGYTEYVKRKHPPCSLHQL